MTFDLVFEGGGAKGMAFVGAWAELRARGHEPGRLLGTSAGAITAALLAAGYTPEEMVAALAERVDGRAVFAGFMGEPAAPSDAEVRDSELRRVLAGVDLRFIPDFLEKKLDDAVAGAVARAERFRHVFALIERGGWYSADKFLAWLTARLDSGEYRGARRAFSAMTLEAFFAATGKELSVVVSDTTDGALLVLNHHTAPACPVVWAVRMSMSIPLVWNEVVWDAAWGPYLGHDMAGHVLVDGGMLSNFPIELFLSDEPQVQRLMGPKQDTPVLGLLIDESLPVAAATRGMLARVDVDPKELKLVRRFQRLLDTAISAHDKMVLDEYADRVARLPARGYGTTEFDMTEERRRALVESARKATRAWLDAHPGPAPKRRAGPSAGPSSTDLRALRLLRQA